MVQFSMTPGSVNWAVSPRKTYDTQFNDNQELKEIPKEWLLILDKVQNEVGLKGAILAGGALRDLNLGGQVKDLDIFCKFTEGLEEKLEEVFGSGNVKNLFIDDEEYDSFDADQLFEVYSPDVDYPIQIIGKPKFSIERVIKSFDIDLCKFWTDGTRYEADVGAKDDWTTKTITISNTGDTKSFIGSVNHAARIFAKYPDFKITYGGGMFDVQIKAIN